MARFFKRLLLVLALLNWLVVPAYSATLLTMTGFGLGGAAGGTASVIQSIQKGSITLTGGNLTGTATITSVNTSNAILIWNGVTTSGASQNATQQWASRIALTNGTTVTATRENSTNITTVKFTVIEFASGVNSIQAGTIAIGVGATSNTATISAVGANAFVIWLGASTAVTSLAYDVTQAPLVLTNSTTVTANCVLASTMTVSYMVVDLDSTIIDTVQARALTNATASTSYTDTITSIDTTRTLLIYNGMLGSTLGIGNTALTNVLTNATTVTLTRVSNSAVTRTSYYTVVQFKAAVVNSLQRGTIAQAAATSGTATITSVTTTKAFVNWANESANGNHNTVLTGLALTNATTVTSDTNTAGSPTTAYEVLEFK